MILEIDTPGGLALEADDDEEGAGSRGSGEGEGSEAASGRTGGRAARSKDLAFLAFQEQMAAFKSQTAALTTIKKMVLDALPDDMKPEHMKKSI